MAPSFCIELARHEEARLLGIARESIERGLVTRQPPELDTSQVSGALAHRLGSFVTLTQRGSLRGCVGSLEPIHPLAHGVGIAAFNAAFRDHRFPPLAEMEVSRTRIEIAVLSQPESIDVGSNVELLASLRPDEDGLLLEETGFRATFLPKVWEKLPDPSEFVRHLKAKAGLPDDYWSGSIRFSRYHTVSIAEPHGKSPAESAPRP